MADIINALKNDLYSNGQINWVGIIFTLSEPIAFGGMYIAYLHAKECVDDPSKFTESNFQIALYLGIAYLMRIPYMWDKPLARVLLIINTLAWIYITYIYYTASLLSSKDKSNTSKTPNKNNTNTANKNKKS